MVLHDINNELSSRRSSSLRRVTHTRTVSGTTTPVAEKIAWAEGKGSLRPATASRLRSLNGPTEGSPASDGAGGSRLSDGVEQAVTRTRQLESDLALATESLTQVKNDLCSARSTLAERETELELARDELVMVESAKKAFNAVLAERDHYKSQLSFSHGDAAYKETELDVLRDGLAEKEEELAEAVQARVFAEQECEAMRSVLREMEDSAGRVKDLEEDVRRLVETRMGTMEELELARADLRDAMARERRQEESSRTLMVAQEELEQAYADAIAQLEEWRRGEQGGQTEEDSHEPYASEVLEQYSSPSRVMLPVQDEEEMETLEDGHLSYADEDEVSESTHAAYEVITHHKMPSSLSFASLSQTDLQPRPASRARSRSRSASLSLKSAFQSLSIMKKPREGKKTYKASAHAIRLFAVRELEDELNEQRAQLRRLTEAFVGTEDTVALERQQEAVGALMDQIRLTATKLSAVRSFAG